MSDAPTAYPLAWPLTWPRTPWAARKTSRFGRAGVYAPGTSQNARPLTIAEARSRLQEELDRLGGASPVLSSNVELRLDGLPRSGARGPDDPGVALYFNLRNRPMVLACDRWGSVSGNIAAIAAHIGALRGMDRWGVGSVEQAFAGYAALPAPETWREVLGLVPSATLAMAEAEFRRLARDAHPDKPGGTDAEMARLNAAIAAARKDLGNG